MFRNIFRKLDQIPQGFWVGLKGPTDEVEGYSLPQELEKAGEGLVH